MDTFAALALLVSLLISSCLTMRRYADLCYLRATDAPTDKILNRKPVPKSASLFTMTMWKMILGQAAYQLAVTFMLFFAGDRILASILHADQEKRERQLNTIVFNTFVWMQIFNQYNNRRLDNKLNIFEGVLRNFWFIGINCIMVAGQIMIIFVGGTAFSVIRIDGLQWAVCLVCAIACLPWAVVLRMIPDKYFGLIFNSVAGCMRFLLKPITRGLKRTRTAIQPFKRFILRPFCRRPNTTPAASDEEAAASQMSLQLQPFQGAVTSDNGNTVPPITITTS